MSVNSAIPKKELTAAEIHKLFITYKETEDIKVRNEIVTQYLPLVHHLARKFTRKGVDYDDLVQVGYYALIKAVERYDDSKDVKFATFATPTIIGEIKHYFRDKQWSVRVPRRIKQASVKIHSTIPQLMQTLHRSPTPKEIAEYLGMDEEEVLEAMEWGQGYQAASLDTVINTDSEDKNVTLLSVIGEEDENILKVEERSALAKALSVLEGQERQLIYLRYVEELSQREVGERLGMSQMQVSRQQRDILLRLKKELERQ